MDLDKNKELLKLLREANEEIEMLNRNEYAVCAILSKLQDFIIQASRSSDSLSDIWASWNPIKNKTNIRCWSVNSCQNKDCDAYGKEEPRCWMLTKTMCCNDESSYSLKIAKCSHCKIMGMLREDTPRYLDELINILIKFLMIRDRELINVAIKDPLTGAYNRVYFDECIQRELLTAERHDESVSLIMADVNKFKTVNDTYGHSAGDEVLIAAADMLKASIRSVDMLFRIGGDEFLLLLPRSGCDDIQQVEKRLATKLISWNRKNEKYGEYHLSVSMGCATWRKGDSLKAKIIEADNHMYVIKEQM